MNFSEGVKKRKNIVRCMSEGDVVIAYERHDQLEHFILKEGDIYQNRFGTFHHSDMIGKPFGSKVDSRSSLKALYCLEPTPELWNLSVDRRTQIVNECDQSLIVLNLDIYSGCKVLESGTGSGCMTMNFARAVGRRGHVYTFEFNKFRAEEAAKDFKKLKVDDVITVQCGNVCSDSGFPGVDELSIDSVFLDLPQPWLALDHVMKLLKPNRPVCLYSPCIEQVIKSCEKLRSLGFYNIRMFEMKQKEMDSRQVPMESFDLGGGNSNSASSSNSTNSSSGDSNENKSQPVFEEDSPSLYTKEYINNFITSIEEDTSKRKKAYEDERNALCALHPHLQPFSNEIETMVNNNVRSRLPPFNYKHASKPVDMPPTTHLLGRTESCMKTHTAYLTFAMRPSIATNSTEGVV